MDIEVGFKRVVVQVGNDQVVIETEKDMPGGRQGDPIWGIFYDAGTREAEITPPTKEEPEGGVDESFVTVTPGKFVIITLAAVGAVINQSETGAVTLYEVYPEGRVWFACREVDVKEADDIIADLLGAPLAEAAKQQAAKRAAQPQVAPS